MKIFDLKLKRSFLGAIGFYFFYYIISVLTGTMIFLILAGYSDSYNYKTFENNFDDFILFGINWGIRSGILISIIFPLTILLVKKIYNASFLLCLLGGALASFGGLLLGLIPSAIISTFYSRDEKLQIKENEVQQKNMPDYGILHYFAGLALALLVVLIFLLVFSTNN